MPIIPARWILALAVSLVLFLCRMLSPAAFAAVPPSDACALFTPSQVSGILGATVSHGQYPIASSLLLCGWTPEGEPQVKGRKLFVGLMTERAFEVAKAPLQGVPITPLKGLADDAYYGSAGGLGIALSIKKGDIFVQIRVDGFPVAKEKQLEKMLAMQLLSQL